MAVIWSRSIEIWKKVGGGEGGIRGCLMMFKVREEYRLMSEFGER